MNILVLTFLYFVFTIVNIHFFNYLINTLYENKKNICDILLATISLFIIFLFLYTLIVEQLNFVKIDYLDIYFGYDNAIIIFKIILYSGFIILITISTASFLYNLFDKNKIVYFVSSIILYLVLYFLLIRFNIINFDIRDDRWFKLISYRTSFINSLIFGIGIAYIIYYKLFYKIENKLFLNKYIVLILFIIVNVFFVKFVLDFYPLDKYKNVLYKSFEKETKIHSIKNLNYDTVNIGDTIQFGERRNDVYESIEWIVLDKNNNENKLLLLSKNGFNVIQNNALTDKVRDYKYYSSYYDSGYQFDESDEKFSYNNSALRFKNYEAYNEFVENNLSKDANEKINEYKNKNNILNTYLDDTNTYEYFFPLNEMEYNKYKYINGVGNFYFKYDSRYIIYRKEFRHMPIVLRTFRENNNQYDFRCVDDIFSPLQYEMDYDNQIKDNNNYIGTIFWFLDKYLKDSYSDDMWYGHIDIVYRPAMWYRCDIE